MSKRSSVTVIICLIFLFLSVSLEAEKIPYKDTFYPKAALIGGAVAGLGVITVYSIGPYQGFSFEEYPWSTAAAVSSSSVIMLSSSLIYSSLLTRSIYENEDSVFKGAFKGAWTGALAGGLANGLSFFTMMGIGYQSGMITFNDSRIDSWYKAAGSGFLGGFVFGAVFGALTGALGGSMLAAGMSF